MPFIKYILSSHIYYILLEHHLIDLEIDMKSIKYFKTWYQNGRVFVHESIEFNTISTHHAVSRLAINWIEI
jgi:hypothetical protein